MNGRAGSLRVLVLTQHYAPEITAARYRVEAFVERLVAHGHEVDVICPVPNHPEGFVEPGFRRRLVLRRRLAGATVRYVWVKPARKKTAAARLTYYASYAALSVGFAAASTHPDVVFASSPPLSVGAAGRAAAALRRAPWILDIRDLWPLAAELIGEVSDPRVLRMASRLERSLYRSADLITAATRPFVSSIRTAVDDPSKVALLPNGTTREWLAAGELEVDRAELGLAEDRFVWTYAGNLGPSRQLEVTLEAAAILGDGFQLVLIGGGGARSQLADRAATLAPGQVKMLGLMPAERAAIHLRASDALLVPQQASLGDFVPSKLYDCSAVGRPLIVAADGETLRLASEAGVGVGVAPADVEAMAAAVRGLRDDPGGAAAMGARGRKFAHEYLRERQGDHLVEMIEELAGRDRRARGEKR